MSSDQVVWFGQGLCKAPVGLSQFLEQGGAGVAGGVCSRNSCGGRCLAWLALHALCSKSLQCPRQFGLPYCVVCGMPMCVRPPGNPTKGACGLFQWQ